MRVRGEDIEKSIFRQDSKVRKNVATQVRKIETPKSSSPVNINYGFKDDCDGIDDDGMPVIIKKDDIRICAKKQINQRGTAYLVKLGKSGRFYNPLGIDNSMYRKRSTDINDKFVKVGKNSFNYYLTFLKTGGEKWLRQAERDVQV